MLGQYPPQNTPNVGSPYIYINTTNRTDLNYGDNMLENAIIYKFGEFLGLNTTKGYLIPGSPDSPYIDLPCSCKGVRLVVDPATVDNDPLVNELIRRYYGKNLGEKIIMNIYNTAQQNGTNILNTKIGKIGAAIKQYYSM
jgi:uncharacterized protein (UPF0297 family)